ncbi:unnamed protein product [Somion occarium]|uniref:SGNH hydrolase-type esterase domain-containing protein n=1 Tax=Somion occarium TaxID=3059160 RepID=A0ABP1CUJ0_9APHY
MLKTFIGFLGLAVAALCASSSTLQNVVVPKDHPLIFFHGRWDKSPETWWAGSGFKLHVENLQSLSLSLGNHTTTPLASIGVSVDYEPFVTVNVSVGTNTIIFEKSLTGAKAKSVVRINVEGWQNNRINLENIILNPGARLLPYTPSRLAFQFIGDSLSAGQFLPQGVDQAWPILTGEYVKAEHIVNAQSGAALTDIVSFGNQHGLSFQFFRTEDTGYYFTTDHNFTTPWEFRRDVPPATHVVIHIGANDSSQNVTQAAFIETFLNFLSRLRTIYHTQPIFVFTPWGWLNAGGTVSQYYPDAYQQIVDGRHRLGDRNVFLVNTTGWVTFADVFPDNQHPNVAGHAKIAGLFEKWLEQWGLQPEILWSTPI